MFQNSKNYLISHDWLGRASFWLVALALVTPLIVSRVWFLPHHFGKLIFFNTIVELLLVAAFIFFLKYKRIRIPLNGITISVFAFWFISGLATALSVQPYLSFWGELVRSGGFFNFTHYLAWFAILLLLANKRETWLFYLKIAVGVSTLVALLAILQRFFNIFNPTWLLSDLDKSTGTLGNPNSLGAYLLFSIFPLAYFAYQYLKKNWKGLLYLGALTIHLVALVLSNSRGAFLGFVAGSLVFLFLYSYFRNKYKLRLWSWIIIGLVLIAVLLSFIGFGNNLPKLFNLSLLNTTVQTRLHTWDIALESIRGKPIIGYGPENFFVAFNEHYDPTYYGSFGDSETWWDRAHNMILEVGVTTGIMGILAYLSMFFFIALKSYRFLKKIRFKLTSNEANNGMLVIIAISSITGYFTQNLFNFDLPSLLVMFYFYTAFLVFLTTPQKNNESPSTYRTPRYNLGWLILIPNIFIIWNYLWVPLNLNRITNAATYAIDTGFYEDIRDQYLLSVNRGTWLDREINNRFTKVMTIYFSKLMERSMKDEASRLVNQTLLLKQKNIEQEPLNVINYMELANIYINQANLVDESALKEARRLTEKALELSPGRQQLITLLAKIDILELKYEDAIKQLRGTLMVNSQWWEAYWWLGIAHHYNGEFELGDKYIDTARKNWKFFDTKTNRRFLAAVYRDTRQYEKLAGAYQKLLDVEPENNKVRALLGGIYRKLEEHKKAREVALQLLRDDPNSLKSVRDFLNTLPLQYRTIPDNFNLPVN